MKKLLLIASFSFFVFYKASAQQDPQYTQFMFNKLAYNSAYAGTEGDKICITGLFRSQWMGFSNGSGLNTTNSTSGSDIGSMPNTVVGSIHSNIGNHFGVGLNIGSDKIGFTNNLNPILSVSYRYNFSNGSLLSAGIGGGIMQESIDGTKLKALDPGDPKIPTQLVVASANDFNFGLYYKQPSLSIFDDFYVGVSATHLNQGKINLGGVINSQMRMHNYLVTGAVYNGLMGGNLALEPNILVKYDQAKLTTDVNVMAMYNNKFRAGLTYRTIDAISFLAGYKFTPEWQIGMAYDFTTSKVRDYSNGTIEIMMKYCFTIHLPQPPPKIPIPRLTPRFL
jgi:type IX secretion system PorP/SprF family membrane protein